MGVSKEQVVELMRPAMYWVSQMSGELQIVAKGNYSGFINRTDVVLTYREDIVEFFGEAIRERLEKLSETLVQYVDLCDVVRSSLELEVNKEGVIKDTLEDVMFWAGEVFYSIERVRETIVLLGYAGDIDEMINLLGEEFVGTK